MNKSDLNDVHVNESQVIGNSLIDSHESDGEDNQVNDRFKNSEGYHAVPLPYTGNYMPPRANSSIAGLDDSVFKIPISETVTSVNETETSTSKTRISQSISSSFKLFCKQQQVFEIYFQVQVQGQRFRTRLLKIQVAQKKVKIAFENDDLSSRV
uniref:Uncharacterized protein n=1 Tax=Tanacetum cinerariifolium TaxID=118510 RepID=A0A6L2L7X8_TANCI|nr:hypothetical protein [Tanacetum cinerariifolium]